MRLDKKILVVYGLLILISSPFALLGSHLIGGRITYRYLGLNKYEFKLIVYRDCSDQVDFDNPAFVSIYNKANNSLVYNKGLPLFTRDTINPSLPNPCFVPPAGICVEEGFYMDTVLLPPNAAGYTISYQRCCHNMSLLNIVAPGMNGTTITTDIPSQINNTPSFLNFPPIFICLSDTFQYSFAATDIDGDNLVYQLCTPLSGVTNIPGQPNPASPPPYFPISWSAGFSATNPVSNTGGMTFNSSTGQLKFKPSMQGQFAVGICVLEYRNNTLINTNRLELQFNVVNCYLVSSIPTATNLCKGLTVNFQNSSTNANGFFWNFGDLSSSADTSHVYSPTYTFPSYGTYTVMLVASNTAYGLCKDTTYKTFNINPLLSPTLQPSYQTCFKNNNINFNVGGAVHPSATYNWNFTANSTSTSSAVNPATSHFTTPSPKTVSVVVSQFGCKDTLFSTITFSNPIASINDANLNCNEKALNFVNSSSNSSIFSWDFGVQSSSSDTSSLATPSYTYPSYGNYTVTLISSDGICIDTLKLPIHVFPKLSLNINPPITPQCFNNNQFNFFANGIYGSSATFTWTIGNNTSYTVTNVENPNSIHFTSPGNYPVRFTVFENGCAKQRIEYVQVLPSPKVSATLSDTVGCAPLTVKFKNLPDSLHPVQINWMINGSPFSDTTVFYNFSVPGLYSFSVAVRDSNNCTDSLNKSNYILVNPKPEVKSFVTPLSTNILYPQVTFIDSTSGPHNTFYSFGDGNNSTVPSNQYSYQSEGNFQYSLMVTNQFGCSDTAVGVVIIDGIASNYVPNIFTPNNDGVNEIFKIKGESIKQSSMNIFNRWGTLVFEGDALKGWNGINTNNGEACSAGAYFYLIKITLENNKSYSFNGTVQLQR